MEVATCRRTVPRLPHRKPPRWSNFYRHRSDPQGGRPRTLSAVSPSNEYAFVTRWRVEASIEEVSEILDDAEGLARWWPSVYLGVHKRPDGVVDLYTKGWLPYTLRWSFRVTERRTPHGFSLEASGDFVGRGVWTLVQDGPIADITYDWR